MFRVFKYRNFRLFFPGLIISQIGIWIQNVAISWLIYEITDSAFLTGLSTFISTLPLFFFTPIAGVLIDKFNKHKLLVIVQILFAIQSLLMVMFYYANSINIYVIVLLGLFLNMLVAIDGPLRQSLFINIVDDKKDLTNAISINSSCFNLVKLIGPAISGLIIAYYNVGLCFVANFLCIIPNIILVILMNFKDIKCKSNKSFFKKFKDGIKYVVKIPRIFLLQGFLGIFCFFVMVYPMLMPIYVKDVYQANADMLGFIMAAIGFGALISSLLLAIKKSNHLLKAIMLTACFSIGICFILLGLSKNSYLSIVIAFFTGLCVTGFITPQISLLQSVINNNVRGRVMSYNTICILGMASLSTIISGTIAQFFGITKTFIIYGIILFLVATFFCYQFRNIVYEPRN